jgi:anti-sigma-K factor RskA
MNDSLHDQFHDEPLHDWLEAYVLGALDPDDRARFEEHLPDCDLCRADLAAHIRMVDLLTYSLPPERPPAAARERLLTRIHAERDEPAPQPRAVPNETPAAVLGAVPSTAVRPAKSTRVRLSSLLWATVLAVVLGVGALVGGWGATGPHASPEVEVLARLPGGRLLSLVGTGAPASSARLFVVSSGSRAELVVDALPPLPVGRTYQLWFAEPGQPIRTGGVFNVNSQGDGLTRVMVPVPLERVTAVSVTQEPAPGSPGPTGIHVLDWTPTGPPVSK